MQINAQMKFNFSTKTGILLFNAAVLIWEDNTMA